MTSPRCQLSAASNLAALTDGVSDTLGFKEDKAPAIENPADLAVVGVAFNGLSDLAAANALENEKPPAIGISDLGGLFAVDNDEVFSV
ncbi:hypothetical protein GCM10009443_18160 [Mucilaginibacter ginsenosidivorans]